MKHTILLLLAATALHGQVTYDRLVKADSEPQNWMTVPLQTFAATAGSTSAQILSVQKP